MAYPSFRSQKFLSVRPSVMDKNQTFPRSGAKQLKLSRTHKPTIEIDNCARDKVESDQATTGREKHRYNATHRHLKERRKIALSACMKKELVRSRMSTNMLNAIKKGHQDQERLGPDISELK
eukprot:scaffold31147_cov150-Skeletonema_dohrnii-CCMP3373.AAC.1